MTHPPGTVLVIDDDADIRETLTLMLQLHGYAAVGAADGREALDELKRGLRPCIILLDLMMPRMNGQQFRAQTLLDPELAGIPVVVTSGDASLQTKAANLGVSGILKKPFDADELLDVVRRHC